eukprot:7946451-Heterocapsa_arctica.AAC.1
MEGRDNTPYGISSTWPAKAMRKHCKKHNPRGRGDPCAGSGAVVVSVLLSHRVGRPRARNPLWR